MVPANFLHFAKQYWIVGIAIVFLIFVIPGCQALIDGGGNSAIATICTPLYDVDGERYWLHVSYPKTIHYPDNRAAIYDIAFWIDTNCKQPLTMGQFSRVRSTSAQMHSSDSIRVSISGTTYTRLSSVSGNESTTVSFNILNNSQFQKRLQLIVLPLDDSFQSIDIITVNITSNKSGKLILGRTISSGQPSNLVLWGKYFVQIPPEVWAALIAGLTFLYELRTHQYSENDRKLQSLQNYVDNKDAERALREFLDLNIEYENNPSSFPANQLKSLENIKERLCDIDMLEQLLQEAGKYLSEDFHEKASDILLGIAKLVPSQSSSELTEIAASSGLIGKYLAQPNNVDYYQVIDATFLLWERVDAISADICVHCLHRIILVGVQTKESDKNVVSDILEQKRMSRNSRRLLQYVRHSFTTNPPDYLNRIVPFEPRFVFPIDTNNSVVLPVAKQQWLTVAEFEFNPFGPSDSVFDPLLKRHPVSIGSTMDMSYPQFSVNVVSHIYDAVALSLALFQHDHGPETSYKFFPVWTPLSESLFDQQNIYGKSMPLYFARCLAEAWFKLIESDPDSFLMLSDSDQRVILSLLCWYTGTYEDAILRVWPSDAGITSEEQKTREILKQRFHILSRNTSFLPIVSTSIDVSIYRLINWCTVRPYKIAHTFFVCPDLCQFNDVHQIRHLHRQFMQQIVDEVSRLASHCIFIKACYRDFTQHPFNSVETSRILWTTYELEEYLKQRITSARKEIEEFIEIDALINLPSKIETFHRRIVYASDNSLGCMLDIGNKILDEHVVKGVAPVSLQTPFSASIVESVLNELSSS